MFFNLSQTAKADKQSLLAFELHKPEPPAAPVDNWQLVRTSRPYELMSDAEVAAAPAGSLMFVDVECFVNYLLISFKHYDSGKILLFESGASWEINRQKLLAVMEKFLTVGFNSNSYDLLIIQLALRDFNTADIKNVSDQIILYDARPYNVRESLNLKRPNWNHIDLIEVAPLKGSLKLYAGQLHCRRMQDLPYPHDAVLTPDQITELKQYNVNDLENTELVFNELKPQLELRYAMSLQYGVDLRSKSDAQIAEAVITSELFKLRGYRAKAPSIPPGTEYRYKTPKFIRFETPMLQEALRVVKSARYIVDESGSINMPIEIDKMDIRIGNSQYHMGIGGLHSCESSIFHVADENTLLIDRDVSSYYPAIILNTELYPQHLGRDFLYVFRPIFESRLEDKRKGNKVAADCKKIVLNGSFGKFGSCYSSLYAPDLMIQVTLTGQLSLLMLIEALESAGIPVVSGNTDGVLIAAPAGKLRTMEAIVADWEKRTGFTTEEGRYRLVYSRDVNSYIAVGTSGKIKAKGAYGEGLGPLWKRPENQICKDAVIALLTNNTPIEETIRGCQDVRKFVTVRNVTGGAVKSGIEIGKVIRWYYSTNCKGEINYIKSGNKVPKTDGAMPLMELPTTLPDDIDFDRYIKIANDILVDIGYSAKPSKKQLRFF